jgi:hypothetical protein
VPTEALTPAAASRSENAIEVHWALVASVGVIHQSRQVALAVRRRVYRACSRASMTRLVRVDVAAPAEDPPGVSVDDGRHSVESELPQLSVFAVPAIHDREQG